MIVLTGSTGFVGRHVLESLLLQGKRVRAIKRFDSISPLAGEDHPLIEFVTTKDLFSASAREMDEMLQGVDTVIHVAWYAEHGKYLHADENIKCLEGTLRFAQAFQRAGGRRFIGIGTCFEYDLSQRVFSVDTQLKPATLYASTKASTYFMLTQMLLSSNTEFAWCRLFYLYGDGEDQRRLVPYLRSRLVLGESVDLTSGRQIRDYLDVKDASKMIVDIALGNQCGAVNICSGIPITVRQMAEKIADEFGRRDLLNFGSRLENICDPLCVLGITV